MSDTAPTGDPAPTEVPADPAPAPVAEAETEVEDPFDSGQDTFDRQYVEKVRSEAAARRVELQPYKEVFDSWDDDSRQGMLNLAKAIASDPAGAGVEQLETVLNNIRRVHGLETAPAGEPVPEPAPEDEPEEPEFLTKEEFQRLQAEAAREVEIQQGVEQIVADAAFLGFVEGTPEYEYLLTVTMNNPEAEQDISKGAEILFAQLEALTASAVENYRNGVQESTRRFPKVTTPAAGGHASPPTPPKTMDEAKAATLQMLRSAGD